MLSTITLVMEKIFSQRTKKNIIRYNDFKKGENLKYIKL